MRKPEQSAEPSIEEILSSIRRIIADDGTQGKDAPAQSRQPEPAPSDEQRARHGHDWPRGDRPYPQEASEAPEQQSDDEILELTEDFLIEETSIEQWSSGQTEPHRRSSSQAADAGTPGDPFASPAPPEDELGLRSVLSNVVAEVDRLSSGEEDAPRDGGEVSQQDERERRSRSGHQAPPQPRSADRPAPEPEPRSFPPFRPSAEEMSSAPPRPQTQPPREAAAAPPAPTPRADKPKPRLHARPVWSARRLEGKAPPKPESAPPAAEKPAVEEKKTEAPKTSGLGDPDRWAEGVHMPVPETGPEMPFPYASEAESHVGRPPARNEAAKRDSQERREPEYDAAPPEDEDEKAFVGDFLTRVFGSTPEADEPPEAKPAAEDASSAESKAEQLAKSTVSDFASEKLGAPAVADALHADKPFMDEIASSLETAMSEADAPGMEAERGDRAPGAANLADHDDLPEAPFLPDMDFDESEPEEGARRSEAHAKPDAVAQASSAHYYDELEEALSDARSEPDRAHYEDAAAPSEEPDFAEAPEPAWEEPQTAATAAPAATAEPAWEEPETTAPVEPAREEPQATAPAEPAWEEPQAAAPAAARMPEPRAAMPEPRPSMPEPRAAEAASPAAEPAPPTDRAELPPGLEDSIKEMIKPLVMQWLNENLGRIVEKAVREELDQRRDELSKPRPRDSDNA